jgi:hypothetical protein
MATTSMGKAVIDQHNDLPIRLRPNYPTDYLLHPVETWILVSIGQTIAGLPIKILFDQVSFQP